MTLQEALSTGLIFAREADYWLEQIDGKVVREGEMDQDEEERFDLDDLTVGDWVVRLASGLTTTVYATALHLQMAEQAQEAFEGNPFTTNQIQIPDFSDVLDALKYTAVVEKWSTEMPAPWSAKLDSPEKIFTDKGCCTCPTLLNGHWAGCKGE